jgi:hypothetical protein
MDEATVIWWLSQGPLLQRTSCQVGFSTVRLVEPTVNRRTFERLCNGERPGGRGGRAYTKADLNAILGPPAAAWVAEPSGPTYDALATAAKSMLLSGRALTRDQLVDRGGVAASEVIPRLVTYPGEDVAVLSALDDLALDIELPFLLRKGSYLVNTEVPPGTYKATDVEDCYWETLDEAGEINDNNFVNDAPQVLMSVNSSDYAVNNDCETMVKVG